METKEFIKITKERSKQFQTVVDACIGLLKHSPKALNYLNSRIEPAKQLQFQFGYFPSNNELELLLSNIPKSILENLNLFYDKSVSFNNHNLIFPIHDEYNNIIGLCGRTLLTEDERKEAKIDKYKYSKGFSRNYTLFGLNLAKKIIFQTGKAGLVEGQIDCITARTYNLKNVICTGGVSFNYYHLYLLKKYGAKKIYLIMDNDNAGQGASNKIINNFSSFIDFEVIPLPNGYKDIDEYLTATGSSSFFAEKGLI